MGYSQDKLTKIVRKHGTIILPTDWYDKFTSEGKYLTCHTKNFKSGKYCAVLVCKKEKGKLVYREYLSRVLLNAPKFKHVDHINNDPMDNRIENLRLASHRENCRNRRKYENTQFKAKGIVRRNKRFSALCTKDGINYTAGTFATADEAAHHYNLLAKWLHGEFANLNILA